MGKLGGKMLSMGIGIVKVKGSSKLTELPEWQLCRKISAEIENICGDCTGRPHLREMETDDFRLLSITKLIPNPKCREGYYIVTTRFGSVSMKKAEPTATIGGHLFGTPGKWGIWGEILMSEFDELMSEPITISGWTAEYIGNILFNRIFDKLHIAGLVKILECDKEVDVPLELIEGFLDYSKNHGLSPNGGETNEKTQTFYI